jgi:threonine dehydrogenase-like Zn-dependent dehydrogenase
LKAIRINADWKPKKDFTLGLKDIDGELAYLGSKVWHNPLVTIEDAPTPEIADDEVLVEVKACGICGSDVHMAQSDSDGYMLYPGLMAFPVTLGHEFAGTLVETGANALDRRTNKPFEKGDAVCAEEMFWCGCCRPCADGYPNHCEALQEIGFSCDGSFAPYVKVKAKYCWSLEALRDRYSQEDLFLAGSLVEPSSVAYNAVIERAGGIRPGDSVAILGGGPIGLAATAVLRRAGASHVVLSEPSETRAELGRAMGATATTDPTKEDFAEKLLEITDGAGADVYIEATGLPQVVGPGIEDAIWARAGAKQHSGYSCTGRREDSVDG